MGVSYGIKYIFYTIFFICPLIFLTDTTRNPYVIQNVMFQIGISLILAIWLANCHAKRKISLPRTYLDKPLFFFFLICFVSVVYSFFIHSEMKTAILSFGGRNILFLLLNCISVFYVTVYILGDRKGLRALLLIAIIVATVASLYAVLQYFRIEPIWPREIEPFGRRSVSTFGNPNFLASFLILILPAIGLLIFLEKSSLRKFLFGGIFALNFAGVLVTHTRSAWFGFLVASVFIVLTIYLRQPDLLRRNGKVLTVAMAMLVLLMFCPVRIEGDGQKRAIVASLVLEKAKSFTDFSQMAYVQRFLIWRSAYSMFKEQPIVGHGWGNFEIIYPFHQGKFLGIKKYAPYRTHANNAHNEILEVVTQTGLVGLGIYIWLFVVFFKLVMEGYKKINSEYEKTVLLGILGGISGMLVDNLLNVSLHFPMPALLFWVLVGLAVGLSQAEVRHREIPLNKPLLYLFDGCVGGFVLAAVVFNIRYFQGEVHYLRGYKYAKKEATLRLAIKECEISYRLYPLNVDNNYELGNAYARLHQNDDAIRAYLQAIRANPGYDEIYSNLGIMYGESGRMDEALNALHKSLIINPLSIPTRSYLAQIYTLHGRWEEARDQYKEILLLDPTNEKARVNLAFVEAKIEEREISPALREKVNALFSQGEKYVQERNWLQAEKIYEEILRQAPSSTKALLYLGNIYFTKGEIEKAIVQYRKLIELTPYFNVGAHTNLGLAYLEMKRLDLAKEEFTKVLEVEPDNPLAKEKLIEINSVLGKHSKNDTLTK